jgi:hypothetical protein
MLIVLAASLAAPLDALDALVVRVHCVDGCAAVHASWDKSQDGNLTLVDADLAALELWDAGRGLYICYDGARVVPAPSCPGGVVFFDGAGPTDPPAIDTNDWDGDGLHVTAEASLGTCEGKDPGSSTQPAACTAFAPRPCAGADGSKDATLCAFRSETCLSVCEILQLHSAGGECGASMGPAICWPRRCDPAAFAAGLSPVQQALDIASSCVVDQPIFALEAVDINNQEALVQVLYYPGRLQVAARVLDLHLAFDGKALSLLDARALPALGRKLWVTEPKSGDLRIMVVDPESDADIVGAPNAFAPETAKPIIEVLFARNAPQQSTVSFSSQPLHQRLAIAPRQGTGATGANHDLVNPAMWGKPVQLPAANPYGARILLSYSFDDAGAPLSYADVPSPDTLCRNQGSACAGSADETRVTRRLRRLQRGVVEVSGAVPGVRGLAATLDGSDNRIELPLIAEATPPKDPDEAPTFLAGDANHTASFWFYAQAKGTHDVADKFRALWALYDQNLEATQAVGVDYQGQSFAPRLLYRALEAGGFETQLVAALEAGSWYHLALVACRNNPSGPGCLEWSATAALSPGAPDKLRLYLNGEAVHGKAVSAPYAPTYGEDGTLQMYEHPLQGATQALTQVFESVYFASAKNNLWGIQEADIYGLSPQTLVRDSQSSARDPDYSPVLDKLVYASDQGGAYEIWLSDGDGESLSRRAITRGFGDPSLDIRARRPRFSPDGRALVFESNAFSWRYAHNVFAETWNLYLIPLQDGEPRIATGSGAFVNVLDYELLAATDRLDDFCLTCAIDERHSTDARWVSGYKKQQDGASIVDAEVFYTSTNRWGSGQRVMRVVVQDGQDGPDVSHAVVPLQSSENAGLASDERTLLAVHAGTGRILYERSGPRYDPEPRVRVLSVTQSNPVGTHYVYVGRQFSAGTVVPIGSELHDLYIKLPTGAQLDKDASSLTTAPILANKVLDLAAVSIVTDNYVRAEIASPIDTAKLEEVVWVFRVAVTGLTGPQSKGAFTLLRRRHDQRVLATTLATSDLCVGAGDGVCDPLLNVEACGQDGGDCCVHTCNHESCLTAPEPFTMQPPAAGEDDSAYLAAKQQNALQVQAYADYTNCVAPSGGDTPVALAPIDAPTAAVFNGDGDRVLMAGIGGARPILVRYEAGNGGLANPEVVSALPFAVRGLSYASVERYHAGHWLGAARNAATRRIDHRFRGGLDELHVYSYVRDPRAIAAEFARGSAVLGAPPSPVVAAVKTCATDAECSTPQLCKDQKCQLVTCDPTKADACANGGRCVLQATGLDGQWLCEAECSNDRDCSTQECRNGGCSLCQAATRTCAECRPETHPLDVDGLFKVETIVGCPDTRSFRCDDGNCETECYAFDDGESTYLCDPAHESCRQGRCILERWDWQHLAPATFSGLGEMRQERMDPRSNSLYRYTRAISQETVVEIQAYGVGDYGASPLLLVEGKEAQGDAAYFEVGRVRVHARDQGAARDRKKLLRLTSSRPLEALRLRLVTPAYENLSAGMTGRYLRESGLDDKLEPNERAGGSRDALGYPIWLPEHEAAEACRARGRCQGTEDPYVAMGHMHGGAPAAIVLDVFVNGTSQMKNRKQNLICPYRADLGGNAAPWIAAGSEGNVRDRFRGNETWKAELVENDDAGVGILNCNYVEDALDMASLELSWTNPAPEDVQRSGAVMEMAYSCTVEVDADRREPCYQWIGADVSLDILSIPTEAYHALDFSYSRAMGWKEVP